MDLPDPVLTLNHSYNEFTQRKGQSGIVKSCARFWSEQDIIPFLLTLRCKEVDITLPPNIWLSWFIDNHCTGMY